MKKILVLTPRFPYPVIGGDRLRIYQLCKQLSEKYELTLLSLCESSQEMTMDTPLDGVFTSIERVYLPKWRSYLNAFQALPSSTPLQVAYYKSSVFDNKLEELLSKHDLALAHLIRTGHYLRSLNIPKVLEMTDAISMNYERVREVAKSNGVKNFIYSIEQHRLKKYEKEIVEDFDLSVLVSQVDKDYLFEAPSEMEGRVLVCSNGVSINEFPYSYHPDNKTIVFIGNMNSVQNLDAVNWFSKSVMPLLRQDGDFSFKVIGRISDKDKADLNLLDGVEVTGAVDSVVEAASGGLLGVCPMRLGAGVQNKVLEYMSLGLPVVTTQLGHEGINAEDGVELVVADEPEKIVREIVSLSNNPERAKALSVAGREFVERNHDWCVMLAPFIKRVDDVLTTKGSS